MRRLPAVGLWLFASAALAQTPNPMDSISKLPAYRPSHDTLPLLTVARIAKYAPAQRREWTSYLQRSHDRYTRDTAAMGRELRAAKRAAMTRAPYTHDFSVKPYMTAAWFAADSARRLAENILSFQAPNGGWSKHVDFADHPRRVGESYFAEDTTWNWISTIDNDATTEQIHFLDRADRARRDERYERSVARAIDYLLASQYPNGCLPQVYPLEGSYHDAATFNDDATVNVLRVFREVAAGEFPYVASAQRRRAAEAETRGLDCILASQVRVHDTLTAWGQQHDPLTLAPTSARSYELTSLTALESASIVDFLMSIPSPTPRVVRAVYAATDWLASAPRLNGYTYVNYVLARHDGAAPLWGRLYEIGTNRVIMANRNGVTLDDWNGLTDRRSGYGWYTTKPAATLAAFESWSRSHPRTR
ncbi:MAG: pectate lyase [Gemmatimonadetes bacterium]|nr:pectate lyase [Gemmatimonadota bacterium]